ncbi:MAG: cellulase family glycosylhydrolase, partial [Bacteroidales bacterium]
RFDSIWSQIATRFAGKSEKLIFEIINEPYGLTKSENDDLHQRILSIIRKTNPTRLVIFQGHNWGGSDELIEAAIPDPEDPYLIGSFHSYDPWPFGLEGTGSFGTAAQINTLRNKFISVKEWSDAHNIPVFLGEFACHSSADFMSRMKHYQTYVELSHTYGFCYCSWDDGGNFKVMERNMQAWNLIKDILIFGNPDSPGYPGIVVYQDTTVKLSWNNRVTDTDRILVQRGPSPTNFVTIDSLPSDATTYLDSGLIQDKTYYYRIIANYEDSLSHYSHPVRIFLPFYEEPVRSAFYGIPMVIPGIIEAEDFDNGGEGLAYHDYDSYNMAGDYRPNVGVDIYDRLGDGFHIGNIMPGEWVEYTVNISEKDTFRVIAHLASPYAGGTFRIDLGEAEPVVMTVRNSGSWLTTDTVSALISPEPGEQIMRFTMLDNPTFNFDKLEFIIFNQTETDTTDSSDTTAISNRWAEDEEFSIWQDGNNHLIISYNGIAELTEVRLYDIRGSIVHIEKAPSDNHIIGTGHLPKGIFLVIASGKKQVYRQKIIIY